MPFYVVLYYIYTYIHTYVEYDDDCSYTRLLQALFAASMALDVSIAIAEDRNPYGKLVMDISIVIIVVSSAVGRVPQAKNVKPSAAASLNFETMSV